MGMFDQLICEMDLPVEACPIKSWQTKSLHCAMDHLAIRASGEIVNMNVRREIKPGAPPEPEMDNLSKFLAWTDTWWETKIGPDTPIVFTGSVGFYAMERGRDWWEFCAFVQGGQVQKIVPVEIPQ